MKTGLRKRLSDEIKRKGYLSLGEVHQLTKYYNHKESYAERVLRPSSSPEIKTIQNEKDHNIGYEWIGIIDDKIEGIDGNASIQTRGIFLKNDNKKNEFKPSEKDILKYE